MLKSSNYVIMNFNEILIECYSHQQSESEIKPPQNIFITSHRSRFATFSGTSKLAFRNIFARALPWRIPPKLAFKNIFARTLLSENLRPNLAFRNTFAKILQILFFSRLYAPDLPQTSRRFQQSCEVIFVCSQDKPTNFEIKSFPKMKLDSFWVCKTN